MAKYRSRGGGLDQDTLGFVLYVAASIYALAMVAYLIYMAVEAKSGRKVSTTYRNVGIFLGVITVILVIMLRFMPFFS